MTLPELALGAVVLLPLLAATLSLALPHAVRRWVGLTSAAGTVLATAAVSRPSPQARCRSWRSRGTALRWASCCGRTA
ncbi:hypothetical protein [Nesterenkonia sp. PF2B19]|uniref:hypothetical protein n=1 Tax=Nesterenkonia sp. PF2B19 TaxID=1881858 RepID=UPI00191C771D|nr:hypothetical protein [Nesterenkonia sp. PF2B19]